MTQHNKNILAKFTLYKCICNGNEYYKQVICEFKQQFEQQISIFQTAVYKERQGSLLTSFQFQEYHSHIIPLVNL